MTSTESRRKDTQHATLRLLVKIVLIVIAILLAMTLLGRLLDVVLRPAPKLWA